jgi:hypothetical protein
VGEFVRQDRFELRGREAGDCRGGHEHHRPQPPDRGRHFDGCRFEHANRPPDAEAGRQVPGTFLPVGRHRAVVATYPPREEYPSGREADEEGECAGQPEHHEPRKRPIHGRVETDQVPRLATE